MPFATTLKGKDIHRYHLPRGKIQYSMLLEWVFAARWGGYKLEEFERLDSQRQSLILAAYQEEKLINAVLQDSSAKEARLRSKNRGK